MVGRLTAAAAAAARAVVGPGRAGARAIRVRTGEHAAAPDRPAAVLTVPDFAAAASALLAAHA